MKTITTTNLQFSSIIFSTPTTQDDSEFSKVLIMDVGKEVVKNWVKNRFDPPLHFKVGDPKKECMNCEKIQVFMVCIGSTTPEMRRMTVSKEATLRQLRQEFGRDMEQEGIYDENHYRFNDSELDLPIYNFSNSCALNVIFQHHTVG